MNKSVARTSCTPCDSSPQMPPRRPAASRALAVQPLTLPRRRRRDPPARRARPRPHARTPDLAPATRGALSIIRVWCGVLPGFF